MELVGDDRSRATSRHDHAQPRNECARSARRESAQAAVEALKAPMNALEESLKGKEYLLGKDFTIADLNVAAVMSWIPMMKARSVVDRRM